MPLGFTHFESGCPGSPSLGFVFDDSGCDAVVAVACCYDNLTDVWSTSVSSGGAISYVDPADQSFWCTSSEASGFASGPYPDGPTCLWKLWKPAEPIGPGCTLTDITSTEAVPFTGFTANLLATQAAQAGRSGHSDEKSYMIPLSGISPPLFDASTSAVVYFGESTGAVPLLLDFACNILGPWTKYGTDIFSVVQCLGSSGLIVAHWPTTFANNYEDYLENFVTGGVTDPGSPIPGITSMNAIKALQADATTLYVLCNGTEFVNPAVFALDKATFALNLSWAITNSTFDTALSMHVQSDGSIYILANDGVDWHIGLLDTATGVTSTVASVPVECTVDGTSDAGTVGFHYVDGFFWIGHDGGNVLKVGPY